VGQCSFTAVGTLLLTLFSGVIKVSNGYITLSLMGQGKDKTRLMETFS
jgi:hypothetical protein